MKKKRVETITYIKESRKNIPTAEYQSVLSEKEQVPIRVAYERRNRDLDPQFVWRGKDEQDWSDLIVQAPPLYIQEKIHPKVLIDDLMRESEKKVEEDFQLDLFSDFNGLPNESAKTEFYKHDANWTNRMILGDSLQVMASLAEREGLRGKVQCIYFDPPYGIKFNSNFQWSTTSRDVRDGKIEHITREPEQVKAFRDTWRDGIHSYLTYLRDRLTVARDLLTESGSVFVQIGDENVHRVRALLDEVFGDENYVAQITFRVKSPLSVSDLARTTDYLIWYSRNKSIMKFRQPRIPKSLDAHPEFSSALLSDGRIVSRSKVKELSEEDIKIFTSQNLASSGYTSSCMYTFNVYGRQFNHPRGRSWKTNKDGMNRLYKADRLQPLTTSLRWRYFFDDAPSEVVTDVWVDTFAASNKVYVVQTAESVIQRCVLMTTDPGDLVLDPTCGSGTTAYVAEQWGRRWITIDTSRVALALARSRIMGARYPYYLLADSPEGQQKEAEISRNAPSTKATFGDIRQGFVYERVPHITLKSIANNTEIDVIWEKYRPKIKKALDNLNLALKGYIKPFKVEQGGRVGKKIDFTLPNNKIETLPSGEQVQMNSLLEWEVPQKALKDWPEKAKIALMEFWRARMARQKEIDASISAKAEFEYLYDKPYEDRTRVRVAGPFTVESLSPHRVLVVNENDELIDKVKSYVTDGEQTFENMILDNLMKAGVQQSNKEDKIVFNSINPWPGEMICAEGIYSEGTGESAIRRRAAIFIGPEFGSVTRPDLVQAAREAGEAGFDVLITCAFNYDAHSSDFNRLGVVPILKARMNADLHMADDLKNTGKGNLFVIFGEPDIDILETEEGKIQIQINGVDVFHPPTGEIRSDGAEGIACWFIDSDYNEESFFVRHAYFLGANDPYKSLKSTLKSEINEVTWEMLYSDISRPFPKPQSGRIAVKVINHLGDEVMKVFRIQ